MTDTGNCLQTIGRRPATQAFSLSLISVDRGVPSTVLEREKSPFFGDSVVSSAPYNTLPQTHEAELGKPQGSDRRHQNRRWVLPHGGVLVSPAAVAVVHQP